MTCIRVFVASPGDVSTERQALADLIAELNETIAAVAPEKELRLELLRWETHAIPSAGRPQQVIIDAIGPYDILIGIMWRRFGTPTGVAESGTEEEFEAAYSQWDRDRRPQIMFYFCEALAPPSRTRDEADQLARVAAFRERLSSLALTGAYGEHSEFRSVVRPHLLAVIGRHLTATTGTDPHAATLSSEQVDELTARLRELGIEYQKLRDEMDPGPIRTRQMELVTTRIRALALQAGALLPAFLAGTTPGERLVAAAFLQVVPRPECLPWLGERLSEAQPFLGYHAAIALLVAARNLDCKFRDAIGNAISAGQRHLAARSVGPDADRSRTLRDASDELARRCGWSAAWTQSGSPAA